MTKPVLLAHSPPLHLASTLVLGDSELVEELVTLGDCLRWALSEFQRAGLECVHGTVSPWNEALALTLGALQLPGDIEPSLREARLLPMERQRIVALVRERVISGRPVAYLLGEAHFAGVTFAVDERVLIPRSPIAELIEARFGRWFPERAPARVLDLCCGSGCIGVATALKLPSSQVDLADISLDALDVARMNISRHDVGDRVRVVASDVFGGVEGQHYDLIVSNPPYVDTRALASLPAAYRHEPTIALSAGRDGLQIVRSILREAHKHLTDHGVLIVEVGSSVHHLKAAFPEVPFLWLELECGGQGVFALTATELTAHTAFFI